jgi:regulator of sigma E protease
MTVLITLAIFIAILGAIIFAHELGHLLAAKWRGVKVDEFGIGFPPRLLSFKKGETVYSLNLIPLGGFTKMAGELDADEERGLQSKGYGSRLLIFAAGSIMNLLLPFLLMAIAVAIPHAVDVEGVKIYDVQLGSPAAQAGLHKDDILLTANGEPLAYISDFGKELNVDPGAPLVLGIERAWVSCCSGWTASGEQQEITVNPPYIIEDEVSKAGVSLVAVTTVMGKESGWQAISTGFTQGGRMYVAFVGWVANLFTGDASIDVVGPIGVADLTAEIIPLGASAVLMWAAMISMTIGIANLLPIPVFDGGHILFVLIEMIRGGKRISLKKRAAMQMVGLVIILSLFVIVGYRDIARLTSGGSLFP